MGRVGYNLLNFGANIVMNNKVRKQTHQVSKGLPLVAILIVSSLQGANAAVALDRTRVIFEGGQKSISLNIRNDNTELPYLAQSWIEDTKGNKVRSPLMALPPLQRLEPGAKSLVKVQFIPSGNSKLPEDRESLFYFNLREIPPKSSKPNVLQLALQTRVKLFYRPKSLVQTQAKNATPWQEKLTLTKVSDSYRVNNPTPYYVTLVSSDKVAIKPVMIAPYSSENLSVSSKTMGNQPQLAYINDWGGRPVLTFSCDGSTCKVSSNKSD